MTTRILTIPNVITVVRAFMLILFWYYIHQGDFYLGLTIFFVSWALDSVDGYIARKYNQATEVGSYLDKFIDRITMAVGVIVLIRYGYVPPYALLLFTREYGTLPVTYPVQDKRHSWQGAGVLGKVTTFGEGAGLLWLALGLPYPVVVVAAVATLGAITAFSYMKKVFIIGVALLVALPVQASVIINEVMWDGDEYIELFNMTEDSVPLNLWKLTRQADGSEEKTIIVFSDDHSVEPTEYFLIEKNEEAMTVIGDVITSALQLLQGGELVRLYNEENILIDSAGGFESWPAGENTMEGISMEKIVDGWQTSIGNVGGRNGTPRAVNSIIPSDSTPTPTPTIEPTVTPTPIDEESEPEVFETEVVINEFLPNPSGDDTVIEFIELYNPGNSESDLSGWQIDDEEGGSKSYTLPDGFVVASGEYRVIYREASKVALNNTGDSVRLLDPDGNAHEIVTYESSIPEGYSVNRNESGDFLQSAVVTPGEKNEIYMPTPSPTKSTEVSLVKASIVKAPEQDDEAGDGQKGDNSTDVKVFRVLPNPVGADADGEFIELKNTGDINVNMAGWKIDDEEGGSKPYLISSGTSISPGEVKMFWREETGIALNNTTDSVRLFSTNGNLVDTFTYEGIKEGQILEVLSGGITSQVAGTTSKVKSTSTKGATSSKPSVSFTSDSSVPKTEFASQSNPIENNPPQNDRREGILTGILLLAAAAILGIVTFDGDQLAQELSKLSQALSF